MMTFDLCGANAQAAGWVGDFDRPDDPQPSWLTVLMMTAIVVSILAMALICSQPQTKERLRPVPDPRFSFHAEDMQ